MFQNYDIFTALTFFLVFLVILEALNIAAGEQNPQNVNPQVLIVFMSLILGAVSGFKVKNLINRG
jgi:hypothetical protein